AGLRRRTGLRSFHVSRSPVHDLPTTISRPRSRVHGLAPTYSVHVHATCRKRRGGLAASATPASSLTGGVLKNRDRFLIALPTPSRARPSRGRWRTRRK